jgi:hypothetical protein
MAKQPTGIGDSTYTDLCAIGDPNNATLAVLGDHLGTESDLARSTFIGRGSDRLDKSQMLYLYGRQDHRENDDRPTVNLIQPSINTFTALATRTDAAITLKSASTSEDGQWVMIKPFTFHAPKDAQSGQPQTNPETGQPYQDMQFQIGQPIPDEALDLVPAAKRICVDDATVTDWLQSRFDYKRRTSRMDKKIRQLVFLNSIYGWPMGLFQWDAVTSLPMFDLYPPQQWFPDPIKSEIDEMSYVRLDVILDCNEAKRRWPEAAASIDLYGSKTIRTATGSSGYSTVYQNVTYMRPVVTIQLLWLRNQDAPMTLPEALMTGLVIEETHSGDTPTPAGQDTPAQTDDAGDAADAQLQVPNEQTPDEDQPGDASDSKDAQGDVDQPPDAATDSADENQSPSAQPDTAPAMSKGPQRHVTHVATGDDLTDSFDDHGMPQPSYRTSPSADPILHPNHPHKTVIREWKQINQQVIPGSDKVCDYWDFPVFMGRNVTVAHRPFSQPETERLANIQESINRTHQAMVDHTAYFKSPTGVMYRDLLTKVDQDLANGHMTPGKLYTVESTGDMNEDIRKKFYFIDPPPMPPALPAMDENLGRKFDLVAGNPGVLQGTPPAGVRSGTAIGQLQAEAQAPSGLKAQYLEETIYRMAMLTADAMVKWETPESVYRYNRKYPLNVIRDYLVPYAQNMQIDVDVSLPIGMGQVKAQKDQQVRQDLAAKDADGQPLIDVETARERLDYDDDEIKRRLKDSRRELAEEQAEIAAMTAPPSAPQKPPESISLAIKFETLSPATQNQFLGVMGLQPTQVTLPSVTLPPIASQPSSGPPNNPTSNGQPGAVPGPARS